MHIGFYKQKFSWKIESTFKEYYQFKSNPKISLLNPTLYPQMDLGFLFIENEILDRQIGDIRIIDTAGFIFKVESKEYCNSDEFKKFTSDFLVHLKIITQQCKIIVETSSYTEILGFGDFKKEAHPPGRNLEKFTAPSNYLNSLITTKILDQVDIAIYDKKNQSIDSSLFLEAIDFCQNNRFNKSILTSAIAVETMIHKVLATQHEILLKNKSEKIRLFQKLDKKAKTKTEIDPIFNHLIRANNLKIKLHECSLYVLNKSMMNSDKTLYDQILKLFQSRNKIAHKGEITTNDGILFSADRKGTRQALQTANKAFKWFDNTDFDKILVFDEQKTITPTNTIYDDHI